MKHLLLLLLIGVSALSAHSQALPVEYTIWGRVVFPDGPARKGVEVRLELTGRIFIRSVTTDEDGRFQFRGLNEGTFFVAVNLEGYEPAIEDVQLKLPNHTQPQILLSLRKGTHDAYMPTTSREGAGNGAAAARGLPAVVDAELFKKYAPRAVREYQDGLAESVKGNSAKALQRFAKAIQLEPAFYEAYMESGLASQQAGKSVEARQAFQRAHELDPKSASAMTRLGAVMIDQARALEAAGRKPEADQAYDAAATALDDALKLDLSSPETHYLLGSVLFKLNELPDAEFNLRQAADAPRPFPEARLMLVNVYVKQRRLSDALKELDAFIAADPNNPRRAAAEKMKAALKP